MNGEKEKDTVTEEYLWVEELKSEYHISSLWISETHPIPSAKAGSGAFVLVGRQVWGRAGQGTLVI